MSIISLNYGTSVTLASTALQSLANSATVGWQSARVDNTSNKAVDYQVSLVTAPVNTAPANDKAVYVYAVPWYQDDAAAWIPGSDLGSTTLPTGTDVAATIVPGNGLRLVKVISYVTQNQPMLAQFNLSNVFPSMPHGWSLVVINYSGITLAASGNIVKYTPITMLAV
jgi:hypothetical protein